MRIQIKSYFYILIAFYAIGTNIATANSWQRFTSQTSTFFRKTVEVAQKKGALAVTLTTPFATPFIVGNYTGKKIATGSLLNKIEKTMLGTLGIKYSIQYGVQNTVIALSPFSSLVKIILSGTTFFIPTISYALGYKIGTLTAQSNSSKSKNLI